MKYKIQFFDYWHMGSGLSAGVRLDSTVVKDQKGLPFISGKTIKGLLREFADMVNKAKSETCFGAEGIGNDGVCIFSNATLPKEQYEAIIEFNLKNELYDEITTTAIDNRYGVALTDSLRTIEVVVPLKLEGEIECGEDYEELIKNSMQMLKRAGLGRNRGFGRCKMEVVL